MTDELHGDRESTPQIDPPASDAPPPRSRRRAWMLVAVIGGPLLAIVAAAIITYAVLAAQRTPQVAAESFLSALVDSDAELATALLTAAPDADLALLGAGTEGIRSFTIEDAAIEGDSATVHARVEQDGDSYAVALPLARVGRDLLVFDVWRVEPRALPSVAMNFPRPDGMELTVNGIAIDPGWAFGSDFPVFPGTYVIEPTGATDWYSAEPHTVTVRFGDSATADLSVTLTEAGRTAAQAAVDGALDACLAQAVLAPAGECGFAVTDDGATYTNIRWSILARPTVTFDPFVAGTGWPVLPASAGGLRFEADYSLGSESGTAEATVTGLEQGGVITAIDSAGVATFESNPYD